jgi:hypothetical protein
MGLTLEEADGREMPGLFLTFIPTMPNATIRHGGHHLRVENRSRLKCACVAPMDNIGGIYPGACPGATRKEHRSNGIRSVSLSRTKRSRRRRYA